MGRVLGEPLLWQRATWADGEPVPSNAPGALTCLFQASVSQETSLKLAVVFWDFLFVWFFLYFLQPGLISA